jgi:anthranilate phosphoribosyltransferase
VVLLNAAAGLAAVGLADDIAAGVRQAGEAIDSGEAARALDKLVRFSSS